MLRASLMQTNEVKFLIRYEIDYGSQIEEGKPESSKMSRFRFCRAVYNLESIYAFTPKRHVHLSTKKANEHIFNIQIVDNVAPGSAFYQTPYLLGVEIINKRKLWTLKKKDERGQFFIIQPSTNGDDIITTDQTSLLTYRESEIKSIFEDP